MKTIPIAIAIGMMALLFLTINPSQLLTESRCNDAPNPSISIIDLEKITWISVMEIRENQTISDCTSLSTQFLESMPKLKQAMDGADQCYQGKDDLCETSSQAGVEEVNIGEAYQPDNLNYRATLTADEVKLLADNVKMKTKSGQSYGDIKYGNRYYQIVLSTSNAEIPPQVDSEFAQKIPISPIAIQKGQSLNFPITVKTLATYGRPAHVQFDASSSALDSNLDLKVEPESIDIPEHSEKNVTLVVTATPDTRDGIYGITVYGKTGNNQGTNPCRFECILVNVNDSNWQIRTYPGNTMIGIGGNTAPKWLTLQSTINKSVFGAGDIAEVTNYLTNNSSKPVEFDDHTESVVTVYSESPKRGYQYYYVIQAFSNVKPLDIQPHSTVLLARPFYMDLTSYHDNPNVLQRLAPGNYTVDIALNGYDRYWWDNDIPIVIK